MNNLLQKNSREWSTLKENKQSLSLNVKNIIEKMTYKTETHNKSTQDYKDQEGERELVGEGHETGYNKEAGMKEWHLCVTCTFIFQGGIFCCIFYSCSSVRIASYMPRAWSSLPVCAYAIQPNTWRTICSHGSIQNCDTIDPHRLKDILINCCTWRSELVHCSIYFRRCPETDKPSYSTAG